MDFKKLFLKHRELQSRHNQLFFPGDKEVTWFKEMGKTWSVLLGKPILL